MTKYILIVATLALVGCGETFTTAGVDNEKTGTTCKIGAEPLACAGIDDCDGEQACGEDALWGTCLCTGSDDSGIGGADGSTGGSGSGGTGGGSDTGGNGSGGSGPCVPETCAEIGARLSGGLAVDACGSVTDRCGNEVVCDSTCGGGQLYCGTSIWNDAAEGVVKFEEYSGAWNGKYFHDKFAYPVNQNLCGNECIKLSTDDFGCPNPEFAFPFYCAQNVTPTHVGNCEAQQVGSSSYWCCDQEAGLGYKSKTNAIY